MFTGETIGGALQTIAIRSRSALLAYATIPFVLAVDLTFMYIWWQAFRKAAGDDAGAEKRASAVNG
jgi:hypothetical protein